MQLPNFAWHCLGCDRETCLTQQASASPHQSFSILPLASVYALFPPLFPFWFDLFAQESLALHQPASFFRCPSLFLLRYDLFLRQELAISWQGSLVRAALPPSAFSFLTLLSAFFRLAIWHLALTSIFLRSIWPPFPRLASIFLRQQLKV